MGTIMFWPCFVGALASPHPDISFGGEHVRLPAHHNEALKYMGSPTPEQLSAATAMIAGYLQSLPGIGLPSEIGKALAGACCNQEHIAHLLQGNNGQDHRGLQGEESQCDFGGAYSVCLHAGPTSEELLSSTLLSPRSVVRLRIDLFPVSTANATSDII
jgi:hypothetical protein